MKGKGSATGETVGLRRLRMMSCQMHLKANHFLIQQAHSSG
jgi:hypothetical protein